MKPLLITALTCLLFATMAHVNADLTVTARAFAKQHGLTEAPQYMLTLRQNWLPDPTKDFRPAMVLIYPRKDGLHVAVTLVDEDIFNTIDGSNRKTWRTGDVAEFFIGKSGDDAYWELHVTPDNHRLQLEWTTETLASFQAQTSTLEDHTIADQSFCTTSVSVKPEENLWQVYFFIPWASLRLPEGQNEYELDFAVCRYDATRDPKSTAYSSTAALTTLSFHRRHEWDTIKLHPVNAR